MFERRRTIGLFLILPAALAVVAGFILPVLALLAESFRLKSGGWGLDGYVAFFSNPINMQVFWRTIRLAALVTLSSAVIGYAAALAIVAAPKRRRGALMGLVILPLMISPVARTYAWVVVLGRIGIVNGLLVAAGFTQEPLRLLFTEGAVFVGLLQLFLPFMILALVSALENLPRDAIDAARTLGAGSFTIFRRVILPLTREGLAIGGALVFAGSSAAFVTPQILGGARVQTLETLLYQRITLANDIATASVIAAVLVASGLVANGILRLSANRRGSR